MLVGPPSNWISDFCWCSNNISKFVVSMYIFFCRKKMVMTFIICFKLTNTQTKTKYIFIFVLIGRMTLHDQMVKLVDDCIVNYALLRSHYWEQIWRGMRAELELRVFNHFLINRQSQYFKKRWPKIFHFRIT